jgi:type I restriction enzyme, S subunit
MKKRPPARRVSLAPGEDAALERELEAPLRRFGPYSEYKDSGVEWLREIPVQWETRRWRYCCRIKEGLVDPRDELVSERILVAPNHIETGTGRVLFTESSREQGAISGKYAVRTGDLVYSKIRPALNKVCIAAGEWLCSADMYPVRIIAPDLAPRFLLYFMLSGPFVRLMVDESMRVAMPKVNRNALSACPIVVPPVSDQLKVVSFLDRETAKIDALVARKQRLIDWLQEKRSAVITQLVTKGLDTRAPLRDSGIEWLGKIPAQWTVIRTKYVARLRSGHTPSRQHPEYWEDCTVPWFGLADVWQLRDGRKEYVVETNEMISELGLLHSAARLLPEGTVILSRTASVGFSAILAKSMATTQDFVNWVCGPEIRPEYLLYVFRSMTQEFRRVTMGSTHQTIYMPDVSRFVTPLPPLEEQDKIVNLVRERVKIVDAMIDKTREAIDRLKEYRTALISAAVTGKIDVREEVA